MTTKINGSTGVEFPDNTVRRSGALFPGLCQNLVISNSSTTAFSVAANTIVLEDSSFNSIFVRNVNVSLSTATLGLNGLDSGVLVNNTWYSIWVISNGTTTGAIFSASMSAPTLPSGYIYKALVGVIRIDNSGNIESFEQKGALWQYKNYVTILNTATSSSITAVDISSYIPVSLARAGLFLVAKTTPASVGQSYVDVLSNSGTTSAMIRALGFSNGSVQSGYNSGELLIETSSGNNIYYRNISGGSGTIYVTAFRLSIPAF